MSKVSSGESTGAEWFERNRRAMVLKKLYNEFSCASRSDEADVPVAIGVHNIFAGRCGTNAGQAVRHAGARTLPVIDAVFCGLGGQGRVNRDEQVSQDMCSLPIRCGVNIGD